MGRKRKPPLNQSKCQLKKPEHLSDSRSARGLAENGQRELEKASVALEKQRQGGTLSVMHTRYEEESGPTGAEGTCYAWEPGRASELPSPGPPSLLVP